MNYDFEVYILSLLHKLAEESSLFCADQFEFRKSGLNILYT